MPDFLSDAVVKLDELVEGGDDVRAAAAKVIDEMHPILLLEAESRLLAAHKKLAKKQWAEPEDRPDQLRFNYNGFEAAISDTKVRKIDEDGVERFVPARFSTAAERLDSLAARVQHHLSHVRRAEAEHQREERQTAQAFDMGLDLMNTSWDQVRHKADGTTCWRCGLGWRSGDPFEQGHSDRPQSQGGVKVEWEHRSCNRSAKDNPVARIDAADVN
jgi:hypothetical protein